MVRWGVYPDLADCTRANNRLKSKHHVLPRLLNPVNHESFIMQNLVNSTDCLIQTDIVGDNRDRAWRRYQQYLHRKHHPQPNPMLATKPVKKWGHLYTRKMKLHRARQLGAVYPIISRSGCKRMADQEWQEAHACECLVCL